MIHVRISTASNIPIKRQTPNSSLLWKNCQFHIVDDIEEYDFWFVFDEPAKDTEKIICPTEHTFLTVGEPCSVRSYSSFFTRQFSKVYTCQDSLLNRKNGIDTFPFLPWFAGARQKNGVWDNNNFLDYNYFKKDTPQKTNDRIAVVCSNKRLTAGHCQRLDFIKAIQERLPGRIDLYGIGFKQIDDKYEVLSKYKYLLVIENGCFHNYWTEKLADAYLCECFPFYIGAPNILDYFSEKAILQLDINDVDQSVRVIKNAMDSNVFDANYEYIKGAKSTILDKYNIFARISDIVESHTDIVHDNRYTVIRSRSRINAFVYKVKKIIKMFIHR